TYITNFLLQIMTSYQKIIIFCLFISFSLSNYAQDTISNLEDSISQNIYSDPNKAIGYLHKYIKLNEQNNNIRNVIIANATLAAAHEVMYEIDSTLFYHYKNLSIVQKPKDIIQTKYSIARVLEGENRYKEALRLYYQVLELAKNNNEIETINTVKMSIATLKDATGKSNAALKSIKADYLKKITNKDLDVRFTRNTLIEAYIKNENFEEALHYIEIELKEAIKENDCEFIYYMNFLKLKIHILLNEFELAKKDSQNALKCAIQL